MGTHTLTSKGIVDNSCIQSISYTILLLQKDLNDVKEQIKLAVEHDMTAFLSSFQEDAERIINEINSLHLCLSSNINNIVA